MPITTNCSQNHCNGCLLLLKKKGGVCSSRCKKKSYESKHMKSDESITYSKRINIIEGRSIRWQDKALVPEFGTVKRYF